MSKVVHVGLPRVFPDDAEQHHSFQRLWQRVPGIVGWLSTTNHKDIGLRYVQTAFVFFCLAGVLAILMRLQLAFPLNHFLGPDLMGPP